MVLYIHIYPLSAMHVWYIWEKIQFHSWIIRLANIRLGINESVLVKVFQFPSDCRPMWSNVANALHTREEERKKAKTTLNEEDSFFSMHFPDAINFSVSGLLENFMHSISHLSFCEELGNSLDMHTIYVYECLCCTCFVNLFADGVLFLSSFCLQFDSCVSMWRARMRLCIFFHYISTRYVEIYGLWLLQMNYSSSANTHFHMKLSCTFNIKIVLHSKWATKI